MTGRNLFPAGYEPHTWDYPESLGYTRNEVRATWDSIKRDAFFWRNLPAYPDAACALQVIHELSGTHDIYFITNRMGVRAKQQTEQWLAAHHHRMERMYPTVLLTGHKGLAARTLSLDAYVDDKPENIIDVNLTGRTEGYLLTRPWNATYTHPLCSQRVRSVADFLTVILTAS